MILGPVNRHGRLRRTGSRGLNVWIIHGHHRGWIDAAAWKSDRKLNSMAGTGGRRTHHRSSAQNIMNDVMMGLGLAWGASIVDFLPSDMCRTDWLHMYSRVAAAKLEWIKWNKCTFSFSPIRSGGGGGGRGGGGNKCVVAMIIFQDMRH